MYTAQGQLAKNTNMLVQQYIPLVKKQASLLHKKINFNGELDDLIQSGMIGLLDALSKYEEKQGAQFETYAQLRIYGAMVDDLRKLDVLSQDDRALLKKIDKVEQEYLNNGNHINIEEIVNKCDISIKKYHEIMQLKNASISLSHDDDAIKYLIEGVSDEGQNIEGNSIKKQMVEMLSQEIDSLPEREQTIMALYYTEELTFKEIAGILELTEARVSQLHNQIIIKLRGRMQKYD